MTELTVFEQINAQMEDMTPGERKVARVIIADYPAAGLVTVAKLAESARVSGQTVIRFSNKLGYEGYPQFQQRLINELHARQESPLNMYGNRPADMAGSKLLETFLSGGVQSLRESFHRLPVHDVDASIELMSDPKRKIVCTGGRFSELMADYLYRHLSQLRSDVVFLPSNRDQRTEYLVDISRKTVVVVFDFRRYQEDTIQFSHAAAASHASIVLVTDPYLSPINHIAEYVMPLQVGAPSPFDTIISATALVETLVAGVIEQIGDGARDRIKEIERFRSDAISP